MLQTLLDNLNIAGADAAEGRARKILLGLGFTSRQMDSPVSKLSGQTSTPKHSCQPAVLAIISGKLMLYSLCDIPQEKVATGSDPYAPVICCVWVYCIFALLPDIGQDAYHLQKREAFSHLKGFLDFQAAGA